MESYPTSTDNPDIVVRERMFAEIKILYERGIIDFFEYEKYQSDLQDFINGEY